MEKKLGLKNNRFYFIDYLRTFAAIIIINSHFDSLYPISALATGGAIGNALFFAISGFCLWPIKKKFGEWYCEKAIKLYIPTLIITIFYIAFGMVSLSLSNAFYTLIWPTPFWFIGAMLLFYPLYYFQYGGVRMIDILCSCFPACLLYILYTISCYLTHPCGRLRMAAFTRRMAFSD